VTTSFFFPLPYGSCAWDALSVRSSHTIACASQASTGIRFRQGHFPTVFHLIKSGSIRGELPSIWPHMLKNHYGFFSTKCWKNTSKLRVVSNTGPYIAIFVPIFGTIFIISILPHLRTSCNFYPATYWFLSHIVGPCRLLSVIITPFDLGICRFQSQNWI
jgi:hypothetical protein